MNTLLKIVNNYCKKKVYMTIDNKLWIYLLPIQLKRV